ncbi:MAG: exodeoxyribonuclease V subunit beta [Deltaproteobacteria bacterium]|nr:exodeoxyribonuclease V subunit beta [Deltaproteobacteria bacterium]
MEPLEARTVPLMGTRLVEASAGTGKTFTLTTLYLRIVLEAGLEADQILVVTFTKAAASELRERIRARLREMEDALASGLAGEPLALRGEASVIDRLVEASLERGVADQELARLRRVLRNFDEAQISTIHSFCDRMLEENAFESGASFDTELVKDADLLREEIANDFWSKSFYDADPGFVRWVQTTTRAGRQKSAEVLTRLIGSVLEQPRIILKPDLDAAGETSEIDLDWHSKRQAALTIWSSDRDLIIKRLFDAAQDKVLKNNIYKPAKIESEWGEMLDLLLLDSGIGSDDQRHKARVFRLSVIMNTTAKNREEEVPEHPFFEACEAWLAAADVLADSFEQRWLALEREFIAYAKLEIESRREARGIRSFGDLLVDLAEALDGPSGSQLAERILSRFPAAMIDEFQDTDPIQYHIFDRIWGQGTGPFFLIGDPKQAIYSFRGADIFAYIRAKRDAREAQYTLDWNWRSDPSLIRAVNCIFERVSSPFLFDEIPFHPARAPSLSRECMGADAGEALRFLTLGRDESGKLRKAGSARTLAAQATAADIARLLSSEALIESEPGRSASVEPADVAILCGTGREAREAREALNRHGIASVMTGQESVFETEEALEFEWLLSAVADPTDLRVLRAAMCTRILGGQAQVLFDLQRDSDLWEAWLEAAQDWWAAWNRSGPIGLLEWILRKEEGRSVLLARPDGERRLTNWLHLGELLQQVWQRGRPGARGLSTWLRNLRQNQQSRRELTDEDALIRLESDERAVKLVTLHSSKGLQYPIVYCPFLWADRTLRPENKAWTAFHDPEHEDRMVLDLGTGPDHENAIGRASWEALAEGLRLLYVGLTRAEHRLVVVWADAESAGSSPLGLLLHPSPNLEDWRENWNVDPTKALREHFKSLDEEEVHSALLGLADSSDGSISVEPWVESWPQEAQSSPPQRRELKARLRTRSLLGAWRISSFSGLTAGGASEPAGGEDHPRDLGLDHDDPSDRVILSENSAGDERIRLAEFPAGAVPGTMIHHVLEKIDFVKPNSGEVSEIVDRALTRHGMSTKWAPDLIAALPDILETPLGGPLGPFSLSELPRADRLDELEFTLPVAAGGGQALTSEGLSAAFSEFGSEPWVSDYAKRVGRLGFAPLEGYLRGFVDLVFRREDRFYVVDYKSNRLGLKWSDYRTEKMRSTMLENDYLLQYHLYVVALHRMLEKRLPDYQYERDMGGVYYLFLRGLSPQNSAGEGLFFDRPPESLILALSEALGRGESTEEGGGR